MLVRPTGCICLEQLEMENPANPSSDGRMEAGVRVCVCVSVDLLDTCKQ